MREEDSRYVVWQQFTIGLCLLIPVLSLLVSALAWLRFGIDLPFVDDWRAYSLRQADTFDPLYLFTPANDTLYVTGKLLDSLAQIFIDGNSIAYQLISMLGVLGGLLILQWKLLILAVKDTFLAASAFIFTVFMIQPGTYWGFQNIAYHQALPLLCLLGILVIVLRPLRPTIIIFPIVFGLSVLGGLAYISGAAVISITGILILSFSRRVIEADRRSLIFGGIAALVGAIPTLLAQLWVIAVFQRGLHRPDASWSLPVDRDFWLFILGKVGRSLGLNALPPLTAFVVALIVSGISLVLACAFVRRSAIKPPRTLANARLDIIYVVVTISIGAYLLMVAAGRANLAKPADQSFLALFQFGYARFHFFWVTLLWPWTVAAILVLVFGNARRSQLVYARIGITLPVVTVAAAGWTGAFDHASYYRNIAERRSEDDVACVRYALSGDLRMHCLGGNPQFDLMPAYLYGREIGASFTRTFPLLPLRLGTPEPPPLFRLSTAAANEWRTNVADIKSTAQGWEIGAVRDPQIEFKVPTDRDLATCRELEIAALIKPTGSDVAQLFYRLPGEPGFSEKNSVRRRLVSRNDGSFVEIAFAITSQGGFLNSVRLDPGRGGHAVVVKDIELRCRYREAS